MCWEREKYSVSLQQENRLTETCVCVCRRADHAPSPAVMHFSGIPSFTAVPDGFQKGKRKKRKKSRAVVYVCCVECQLKQLASYGGKKKKEILKWFERRKRKKKGKKEMESRSLLTRGARSEIICGTRWPAGSDRLRFKRS